MRLSLVECCFEVAWELEKVLIYHCINSHPLRLLNQEAVLARQGLDPISRKVRTPGRNRAGYVVFLRNGHI